MGFNVYTTHKKEVPLGLYWKPWFQPNGGSSRAMFQQHPGGRRSCSSNLPSQVPAADGEPAHLPECSPESKPPDLWQTGDWYVDWPPLLISSQFDYTYV